MEYILFAIVGMTEVGPNICKIDYQRYVDIQSVTIPCSELKKNIIEAPANGIN